MVSDDDILHIKYLYPHKTKKQFINDIDFILNNFTLINLNDLLSFVKNDTSLPPNALLLTFDDGFREVYDIVAPILLNKGISATFFISSSFTDNKSLCYQHKASLLVNCLCKGNISSTVKQEIEGILLKNNILFNNISSGILAIKYEQRNLVDIIATLLDVNFSDYLLKYHPYLTTGQIIKMIEDGFSIGAHSIDHPLYKNLTLEDQLRQTIESVNFVKKTFNLDYGAFAFPHSDNGVSKQYFKQIEQSGLVDISFGTSGMIEDCTPNNLQRFSLEKPLIPAEKIIKMRYMKNIYRNITGKNQILRD
jgi:peptidoglycan/xylan/chitin deacetylase (PgdA/CDA1 family)